MSVIPRLGAWPCATFMPCNLPAEHGESGGGKCAELRGGGLQVLLLYTRLYQVGRCSFTVRQYPNPC